MGGLEGRGVSGERFPVLGEIWRDASLGGVTFENRQFIVIKTIVKNMP